jgi:hypothetical protein
MQKQILKALQMHESDLKKMRSRRDMAFDLISAHLKKSKSSRSLLQVKTIGGRKEPAHVQVLRRLAN